MSKIGKINISIPEKVKVVFTENILRIEGPLGKKSLNIDPEIFSLNIIDGKEIAMGALAMGATAKQAVLICNDFSLHCGKGVEVFSLQGGKDAEEEC